MKEFQSGPVNRQDSRGENSNLSRLLENIADEMSSLFDQAKSMSKGVGDEKTIEEVQESEQGLERIALDVRQTVDRHATAHRAIPNGNGALLEKSGEIGKQTDATYKMVGRAYSILMETKRNLK